MAFHLLNKLYVGVVATLIFFALSATLIVSVLGTVPSWAADLTALPTKTSPLIIDSKNKQVLIYTEINTSNWGKTNPHWGVVYRGGKLGEKAILSAYCSPLDFHKALTEIGAKPGENLTPGSMGEYVKGSPLKVTAVLPGLNKELSLEQIIEDSSGKSFQIRFGGNRDRAVKEKTGCITCLESCPVGITSNAAYPAISSFKRLISPNSRFKGKPDVLPNREGTPVILIYRLEQP
jgi:hypothetical protein